MLRRLMRKLSNRGGVMVLVTLTMLVLMGMGGIAIDLGMLIKARGEAQRAADASALGGASAFLLDSAPAAESTQAVLRAKIVADTNYMNGVKFDTASEVTVWVITDSVKVRVLVRRAAVPTWFARLFGLNQFPVGARAAAVASYGGATNCVKPVAISDIWDETNDVGWPAGPPSPPGGNRIPDPGETWLYDPNGSPPDSYAPAHDGGVDGAGIGYGSEWRGPERDWGLRIVIRSGVNGQNEPCPSDLQGNKCFMPGWWGLWGANGTPGLRAMMQGCDTTTRYVGDEEEIEPGWRQPISQDAYDLWRSDSLASWDDTAIDEATGNTGTVVGSMYGDNWRASKRTWIVAAFAPDEIPSQTNDPIEFNNYMQFWFEGCWDPGNSEWTACDTQTWYVGRFAGPATATASGPTQGTMVRILRLVE